MVDSQTTPPWQLKKIEELVKIFMEDYGASESLAREEAWKFKERLEKELADNEA